MSFDNTLKPSNKMKGGAMRGKRQLEFTCLGIVIKRLMQQLKLNLQQVAEGSTIPYTTLYDWSNGVIPNNPDQLLRLKDYFNTLLEEKISVDYLLYGVDEDHAELKKLIAEQNEKIKNLELENATQGVNLNFMQWLIDEEKKNKKQAIEVEEVKKILPLENAPEPEPEPEIAMVRVTEEDILRISNKKIVFFEDDEED